MATRASARPEGSSVTFSALLKYVRQCVLSGAQDKTHARREIFEAESADPKGVREGLRRIGALYDIEQDIREQKLAGEAKRLHRLTHSKPHVEAFFDWVNRTLEAHGLRPMIIPADDGHGFQSNVDIDSIGTWTGVWHVRRQNPPGAGIAVTMPLRHRGQDATNGEALGQGTRSDGRRTQRRFCERPAATIEIRRASHLIVDSRAHSAPSGADSRPLSTMARNRCSRSME